MSETVVEAFTACNYPSRLAYDTHRQKVIYVELIICQLHLRMSSFIFVINYFIILINKAAACIKCT